MLFRSVVFSGSGNDPDGNVVGYSWTFAGGNPGAGSGAAPGSVTYSTPGVFTASLKVTDNEGLASQSATRTVTVSDFSISATPSSRTVTPGASAGYSATIAGINQFSGTVAMTISGLPTGATASFTPDQVLTGGSTTLTVSTSSSTPAGTYQLTIRGTSGPLMRTATVTLVVSGNFSLAVTPSSRTIAPAARTTYTVAATPGFSGTIALAISGLPKFASASFNPSTISGSGTSTLTINTNKNVARGTYTLTITGSSGGIVATTNLTLVIQ